MVSPLFQVMACYLLNIKQLPEVMLIVNLGKKYQKDRYAINYNTIARNVIYQIILWQFCDIWFNH